MKITIDVHEMKCSKCASTASVLPRLLYPASLPANTKSVLSALVKGQTISTATDGGGNHWTALIDSKPAGWTKVGASDLCAACSVAWVAAEKAFLEPLPPSPIASKPTPVAAKPAAVRAWRRPSAVATTTPIAPTPAVRSKPMAPPPFIAKSTYGSSVPPTFIHPIGLSKPQPLPPVTKQGPEITFGGGCSTPKTCFGSTVSMPASAAPTVAPRALPPTSPRPTYGGGDLFTKLVYGTTVPVPSAAALAATSELIKKQMAQSATREEPATVSPLPEQP